MKNSFLTSLLIVSTLLVTGCKNNYEEIFKQRETYSLTKPKEIVVAVIKPQYRPGQSRDYLNGINFAIEKIDNEKLLLNDRFIKTHIIEEKSKFDPKRPEVVSMLKNPKVVAVLGHSWSSIALPASIIYESSGLIFMPSFATSPMLGGVGRPKYLFKMLPDNRVQVDQIINLIKLQGSKRVVVFNSENSYDKDLGILFSSQARDQKLTIVEEFSYPTDETDFNSYIAKIKTTNIDSIVISSSSRQTGKLIQQLRKSGISRPIFLTDSADRDVILNVIGDKEEDIITITTYDHGVKTVENIEFIEKYEKRFGKKPDRSAAIGYDSLMLLAHAINLADSSQGKALSLTMHSMPVWPGLVDTYKFDEYGGLKGKKYKFVGLYSKEWNYIPYAEKWYASFLLSKATDNDPDMLFYNDPESDVHDMEFDKYDYKLLKLAYHILKFDSLGVIYIGDETGKRSIKYNSLKRLSKDVDFDLQECVVPAFIKNNKLLIKDYIRKCFREISLSSKAIFFAPSEGIDVNFYQYVLRKVDEANVPVFSIGENEGTDKFSVFYLNKSPIEMTEFETEKMMPKVLFYSSIYNFYNRIKSIPEVSINTKKYEKYNLNEDVLLSLSPLKLIPRGQGRQSF